jgi:hypothetical protein
VVVDGGGAVVVVVEVVVVGSDVDVVVVVDGAGDGAAVRACPDVHAAISTTPSVAHSRRCMTPRLRALGRAPAIPP